MPNFIDLTGKRFGRLLVLERTSERKGVEFVWAVRCDCGTETTTVGVMLRNGEKRSCGCLQREFFPGGAYIHGKSKRPTWNSWRAMMRRCYEPPATFYEHYGGRGITVCDRWHQFDNFLMDMGERAPGMTIERHDVNGNYEPGNCRWATMQDQAKNKRTSLTITIGEKTKCVSAWCDQMGVSRSMVYGRIKAGQDPLLALTTPSKHEEQKIEINGRRASAAQWAREASLQPGTVHKRLRDGWPPALAVSTPGRNGRGKA